MQIGQIWEGYKESPCDYYTYDKPPLVIKGNQKIRPFLITKINKNGTVRVVEGSTSIKDKKWEYKVITLNNDEFIFDIGCVYNLPIRNLKRYKYDLFLNNQRDFDRLRYLADKNYLRSPEKREYERKLISGELAQMSKGRQKYERTHNQFSVYQLKHIYDQKVYNKRLRILAARKNKK